MSAYAFKDTTQQRAHRLLPSFKMPLICPSELFHLNGLLHDFTWDNVYFNAIETDAQYLIITGSLHFPSSCDLVGTKIGHFLLFIFALPWHLTENHMPGRFLANANEWPESSSDYYGKKGQQVWDSVLRDVTQKKGKRENYGFSCWG